MKLNQGNLTVDGALYSASGSSKLYDLYITNGGSSTSTANTRFAADSHILKITSSSERWKHDICNLGDYEANYLDAENLYNIPVRQFTFNDDYLGSEDSRSGLFVSGLVAEEVAEYYPIAAKIDEQEYGRYENWNERFLIPPMLKLIQDQKKTIDELLIRIKALEEKLS